MGWVRIREERWRVYNDGDSLPAVDFDSILALMNSAVVVALGGEQNAVEGDTDLVPGTAILFLIGDWEQ